MVTETHAQDLYNVISLSYPEMGSEGSDFLILFGWVATASTGMTIGQDNRQYKGRKLRQFFIESQISSEYHIYLSA